MKINNCFIVLLCCLFYCFSCENDNKKSDNLETKVLSSDSTQIQSINLYFLKNKKRVNKIFKDSTYTGVIEYKSPLDTITTNLYETEKFPQRAILFYKFKNHLEENPMINAGQEESFDELLEIYKNELDTIYAVSNKEIPLFDLKFSQLGTNYISGVIEDFAYLKISDTSKVRFISKVILISLRVEVIEPKLGLNNPDGADL